MLLHRHTRRLLRMLLNYSNACNNITRAIHLYSFAYGHDFMDVTHCCVLQVIEERCTITTCVSKTVRYPVSIHSEYTNIREAVRRRERTLLLYVIHY